MFLSFVGILNLSLGQTNPLTQINQSTLKTREQVQGYTERPISYWIISKL